ncbi:MAG: tetratricopeptide repeat protein [Acidobacteria bacterium]|nr:tetratricopeptide repeat protein [Acidobacteriota bacterium]
MYRYIFYLLLLTNLSSTTNFAQNPQNPQNPQNQETQEESEKALMLYQQAETAYEKGDLNKAIELYKQVIKILPESFEPKYQCANALIALGKSEVLSEAASLLKEVTTLKPDFARGFASLGNVLIRLNDFELAEMNLRQALNLDNKLPIHSLLAEVLFTRQAYKEAETELKLAINQGQADAQNYLLLAICQEEQNQAQMALASYNKADEIKPKDSEILYRRGKLYLEQKNFPNAIADLKIAYEISQNNIAIGLVLIDCYRQSGDKKNGLILAQALLDKSSAETQAQLTELLAQLGANDGAIAQLEKLLQSEPKNVKYLARLGELYLDINPGKAAEHWQTAVNVEPSIENLVGLASALLKAQKFAQSIEVFKSVLLKSSNNYEAHAGLALALFKLDQFATSAQEFIWIIKAKPENSISYYFLGICFDRLGDYRQALSAYEVFLKKADPKLRQLEIEKVNLRLPILRKQVERQPKGKNS